ncbi:uncharacterized protein PHALS_06922 [Plasmopara halstedii]|uniref:Uncharacterized protein n=1 Tax=Plasmopara halstedii TaxID=4781 RepID=A0A0P1B339_PLAHL|nr:uncharacterized protein PHALS_06922 [Plasmopara halstedii]CEG49142.1 hypothetical protein PHALS_06922 [Plasmopara halstedii]|eukprot:XP_024585511.1 hypothetical protein PHALS_06922 [Plasmopara halstedii]
MTVSLRTPSNTQPNKDITLIESFKIDLDRHVTEAYRGVLGVKYEYFIVTIVIINNSSRRELQEALLHVKELFLRRQVCWHSTRGGR